MDTLEENCNGIHQKIWVFWTILKWAERWKVEFFEVTVRAFGFFWRWKVWEMVVLEWHRFIMVYFVSILYIGLRSIHIIARGCGGGTGKVLPIIHRKTRWLGNCLFVLARRFKIGS